MQPAIRLQGLTKRYKSFTLDDVSFDVPSGSIVGFIGENGAGKTTTIKLLCNLIHRDAGSIEIFDQELLANERAIKERMGVVLSESGFAPTIKAKDVSRILRGIFPRWDAGRYDELLRQLDVPTDKTYKEFSSGMKMKLAIAVALSHDPELLVLDEATSGLDPVVRNQILDMLLDFVQDETHSVLISSHITSDLERVADYIAFIHKGKLAFCRSKDDLLESYGLLKCPNGEAERIDKADYHGIRRSSFGAEMLVDDRARVQAKYPGCAVDPVTLEDIMVFYSNYGKDKGGDA